MKTFEQVKAESTCQKRITICEIYCANGKLLARESNRCAPTGGSCHRIGVVQDQLNYDTASQCNWTHAEINAANALHECDEPFVAILYGHDFFCQPCIDRLFEAGVRVFIVSEHNPNK